MRKLFPAAVFAALLIFSLAPARVEAYSPHYLPGGKNYLSVDNFEMDGSYYSAIENFLVKPNTTYCLSVGAAYAEDQDLEIILDFFANAIQLGSLTITRQDLSDAGTGDWWSYVFTAGATANYLDIYFLATPGYFDQHDVDLFQLEEGSAFTGWEAYIPGELADVNGPYFEGNAVALSNVDDPLTEVEIRAGLVAVDAIDGDVTADIEPLSDGYTGHEATLGSYVIVYGVTDAAGNATSFQVTVRVVDVADPFFGGTTVFTVPYPTVRSLSDILAEVTASDNYDGDLSGEIAIVSDGYSANAALLGTYDIVLRVVDSSGNESTRTVTVTVVDRTDPIFSGPAAYTIGYDNALTVAAIKSALSVVDDYDLDLTSSIVVAFDGYSANMKCIGAYTIVFRVADSSGNTTDYNVLVNIVDGIGPVVYVDASIVRVYNSTVLSLSDFTALLVRAGELREADGYAVTVRYDSYSSHAAVPGIYHLALDIRSPEGDVLQKTFQIMVSETPSDYVPGPGEPSGGEGSFMSVIGVWIAAGTCFLALVASNVMWILKMKKR